MERVVSSEQPRVTFDARQVLRALKAVRKGDFSVRLPEIGEGAPAEIVEVFNDIIEMNQLLAAELSRIARAVGKEGRIAQRASLGPVGGSWGTCMKSVNTLITDLVQPTTEVARVIGAVARGDLSQKMTTEVEGNPIRGEFARVAKTVNAMVDQLGSFASEVTRVAREVGIQGKLGGQARVKGVAGTWKALTDSVNSMASNLTAQVRNIAEVTTAVANGDLSKKITVDVRGEILELKDTINTMVDQLRSFASEVTRVAKEVGTDGKLGGQAEVRGVAGIWKDLTDNVNLMAANLTDQVRNIAEVTTAVANGDLSTKITVDVKGEILELKNTINTMVDQLSSFASEVTRVAREVGTDGKLGGQAEVQGVAGTWKDLTDNVNLMGANLTDQVRNIAEVTTAVANGDLSKKITVDVKGEILELKNTINTMVDQLSSFASEVTRVAREVGIEGKLGGQAQVEGVAGTWKDLTDNVNLMGANLTDQVRNIAEVTTAVAKGDLSTKITVDVKGEILELKNTINTMVDQLSSFASEVTRVAREVGTEGKLGGQARVEGVAGTWKDLTDNANLMAANLTDQVRNIAQVTTAVANGDLSTKITVDVKGEILELKNTINTMVDQLSSFASEVTRVAKEVGTDGKLGGQARVEGVAGTWKDLTDNVNRMASNLTDQVRNIAEVTTAVAKGDLSKKITVDVKGEILELKDTINTMVDQLRSFASEVTRVAREVGTEGNLGGQARVEGVAGTWKDLTENANLMAANLTAQVRNIAEVTTAVANGDLSKKITVDVKGEILELKNTINTMVDQLSSFASEVTRVAREVGTEGKLGGQAQVKGVGGTWKDLTDNVNQMAANLTAQVRGIAKVVTGVANGDLRQKLTVEAKGEIAALAETINGMIGTLAVFADQVTSVAREVGVEGKLGGQARVPGAAGTWRDLTDNVNQLAANLTTQVRAIAEVATAVTKGDLTRSISVDAQGEVASLKDNINEMIRNLRDTTHKSTEQDWLKTNLARFSQILQGQRGLVTVSRIILSELVPLVSAVEGALYHFTNDPTDEGGHLRLAASYARQPGTTSRRRFELGEGLVGQCAVERKPISVSNIPSGYLQVASGLGEAAPLNLILLPVLFEGNVKAVIELASFQAFSDVHQGFLAQLTEIIGIVLNNIAANMRTEALLEQSQSLTKELRLQQEELKQTNERLEQQAATLRQSEELLKRQQEELQRTNEELEEKARLLQEQKTQVEVKNREVELAKKALEEKAEQLALTSKYKSQFLANMSHELRTPLNSLLILARLLAENPERNLAPNQVEFANSIHASGTDLLSLINDILDLSKIESGTVSLDISELRLNELSDTLQRAFRQIAENKGLFFRIDLDASLPRTLQTDAKRLQQVLTNLLSNAFKFTDKGGVEVRVAPVKSGWTADHPALDAAPLVLALSVEDTGIGIADAKQRVIFEAFSQADMTTSRKYGGTGLGLSISRELAEVLGGEIVVRSAPGAGSSFTLFLPQPVPGWIRDVEPAAEGQGVASDDAGVVQDDLLSRPASDDRADIQIGDRVLLALTDDPKLTKRVISSARRASFKCLVGRRGERSMEAVREFQPDIILLELVQGESDGWTVLDQLKHDAHLRHVPVCVVVAKSNRGRALQSGAVDALQRPIRQPALAGKLSRLYSYVDEPWRDLLVVAPPGDARAELADVLASDDVRLVLADDAQSALNAAAERPFDCVVLSAELTDQSGRELASQLSREGASGAVPSLILWWPDASDDDRASALGWPCEGALRVVDTPARLVAVSSMLLHRPEAALTERQQRLLHESPSDGELSGSTILIVDDDVRNIFAVTSALERHQMTVLHAENGRDGISILEENPAVNLVLMDIMMPEMDGYETLREIRKQKRFKDLPIIALTAKAMKGDREKCLKAGASEYVAKPVDLGWLTSLVRVQLRTG